MICTEVGELMQRQLDHDLDERELTVLMTHLGECKACQSLFERLTLLSGSLEQLPRVTPSISIVDSILPELEAIDRQRAEQNAVRPINAGHWKRWMTAAASVAAAAAVVFVMSNLDLGSRNSNDTASQEIAMSQDTSGATRNEIGFRSTQNSINGFNPITDEMFSEMADDAGYQITPLSSPIESMRQDKKGMPSVSEPDSSEAIEKTPVPTTHTQVTPQVTINEAPLPSEDSQNTGTASHDGNVKQQNSKDLTSNEEILEITVVDQYGEEPDGEQLEGGFTSMGIVEEDMYVEKHFSPDGQVYIVLDGHTIVLYETSTDQQQKIWSIDATGMLSFVEWDNSSSFFVYELLDDNGQSSRHTVNLND